MTDTKKIIYIKGPVLYAKVFERNRDKRTDYIDAKFDGRYSINIGVGGDLADKVKTWNRLYEGKTITEQIAKAKKMKDEAREALEAIVAEHGDLRYFEFWRNHKHVTKADEEIEAWGGAPTVVDSANFAFDPKVNIGNGSVCTIKLSVNTVGRNTYVRLEGVRVEDLVEFEGADEVEVVEENDTDGLAF